MTDRLELQKSLEGRQNPHYEARELLEIATHFASMYQASLRAIEQYMARVYLALRKTKSNQVIVPSALATMVGLECFDPELFRGYCAGTIGVQALFAQLRERPGGPEFATLRETLHAELLLTLWSQLPEESQARQKKWNELAKLDRPTTPDPQEQREYELARLQATPRRHSEELWFEYMLGKINLGFREQ